MMQDNVSPWKIGPQVSVAYTGTAGTVQNASTTGLDVVFRVVATTDAFIAINLTSVAATTAGYPVYAKVPEYIRAPQGSYFSAIQSAAGGTLYVTEMSK